MKSSKLTAIIVCALSVFTLNSCIDVDKYRPAKKEDPAKYSYEKFENFRSITITNSDENAYISVFFENPFTSDNTDDAITATSYASGRGKFNIVLDVPNHVNTIYVLNNNVLQTYPVGNITLQKNSTRAQSFSDDELNALVTEVRSKYFPSAKYNVRYHDLYTCCDLYLGPDADHQAESIEDIEMSLVYLDDGHKGLGNLTGNMFIYLYPTAKMNDLQPEDCVFFGAADDAKCTTFDTHIVHPSLHLQEMPFASLKDIGSKVARKTTGYNGKADANYIYKDYGVWPIFYSKNPNFNELKFSLSTLNGGKFLPTDEGTWNMGFLYIGGQNLRFSTPALNIGYEGSADKAYAKYKAGAGNYLGYKLTYNTGEEPFTIDQNVSNGFIHHVKLNGKEYNVLGMENQYPYNKPDYYDGDYDDMMMIIVSNPSYIKPIKEIPVPNTEPSTFRQGYYLFEDNFPDQGDYDFNDVIIQYSWRNYPSTNMNYISCAVVAKGCSFKNKFGFLANGSYDAVIEDISGFYNVNGGTINTAETRSYTYEVKAPKDEVTPFLYNGRGHACKSKQGSAAYPYVLDIPYSNGHDFRWMTEGYPITDGYYDITSDGWYNRIKNEEYVMKR